MTCMSTYPPFPMPAGWMPVWVALTPTQVREIEVDAETSSKTAITGGWSDSRLTVEYYVEPNAGEASVTVTMTTQGQTTTWADQAIAAGYHTHVLPPSPPGTKIMLQASAALARARWCETVCC